MEILQKPYGRTIKVGLVDAKDMSLLGFVATAPRVHYLISSHGKFGVKVLGTTDPIDVEVHTIDGSVCTRNGLEPNQVHIIRRTNDNAPLRFNAPDATASSNELQPTLLEEAAATNSVLVLRRPGLIVVRVRFSDVPPDHGPQLPPDEFTDVLFQLNTFEDHSKVVAQNLARMEKPAVVPKDLDEFGNPVDPARQLPERICCIANDRSHYHS